MSETLAGPKIGEVEDLTASGLLELARNRKAAEERAAADLLRIAAQWADLHPPESMHDAASFTVPGWEHEEPIAGEGTPLVAEFCVAELGGVLGMSSTGAKKLIGHALELRHRLPRLWAQVQAGRVPAWKARAVAEATIHSSPALTKEAAGFVDAQVAAVAGKVGRAQLDRLVAEAIKRYDLAEADPTQDPEDGYLHVDPRHVTVDTQDVHFAGTMRIEAEVDIADALDLAGAGADPQRLPAAREVVLHAHFDAGFSGETTVFGPTGRLEEGQRLVLLEQVRSWCSDSRTKVTIKPIIDLNTQLLTDAYAIADRIREQVVLRDRTCVFPWCTRPARRCDIDHVIPYDPDAAAEGRPQPGPTQSANLAALCRFHHRLKTHSPWRYDMVAPGVFEWTSPHGHRYRRDHTGTGPIDDASPPGPPDPADVVRIPRPRRP